MKRVILLTLALSLALCAAAVAQDETVAAPRGAKAMKADTNGDGKISKDEFMEAAKKRAEARFQKLDANGDGFITADELNAAKSKRAERAAKKAAAKAPQ